MSLQHLRKGRSAEVLGGDILQIARVFERLFELENLGYAPSSSIINSKMAYRKNVTQDPERTQNPGPYEDPEPYENTRLY